MHIVLAEGEYRFSDAVLNITFGKGEEGAEEEDGIAVGLYRDEEGGA
jgi:hypothetical protein